MSQAIDATFRNSLAETLTETEKAFQLGFVAMTEAILLAIQAVCFVVIVIIMAVMANTMAMTARERNAEYATLKALGFGGGFVAVLIFGRVARHRAGSAASLGIALTFPLADAFASTVGSLFPVFIVARARRSRCSSRAALVRRRRRAALPGRGGRRACDRRRPARDRLTRRR